MSYFIDFLAFLLVIISGILSLLILVQLPKKEAGAGLAFGGGTTDALFGAGSGNVLTKVTKYAIGVAFVLWMLLGGLQSHYFHKEVTGLQENYGRQPAAPLSSTAPYTAPAAPVVAPAASA